MAFITLKDIGKIYVSAGNVSVGIRGVNLSFDRGEFVAVTGESGSGKSTLLNVISGMDTYEEGEMYVEGEPTSHYVQQDWEEYRRKYISFIFQDYNIIESFTELQNVELSLMDIKKPKERRARAVELLRRVGLEKHLHHKGSRLSGGQKQRTVIARALAKDSPVILADEPTGNLDSQSSREIIELLREVSKDKLVIIVTHNFDQVQDYATRHIRVFDGAIEFDRRRPVPPSPAGEEPAARPEETPGQAERDSAQTADTGNAEASRCAESGHSRGQSLRNGLILGWARFGATPKLSVFLCVLMVLCAIALTFVTSLSGGTEALLEKNYLFSHVDGRTVIARRDGKVMSEEELAALAAQVGAESYQHYDLLLDAQYDKGIDDVNLTFRFLYDDFADLQWGRAPEKENEVMLRVPVSLRPYFGTEQLRHTSLKVFGTTEYTVTGVSYYYDNTKPAEMIFTKTGYECAAAISFFSNSGSSFLFIASVDGIPVQESSRGDICVSFGMPDGTYYVADAAYRAALESCAAAGTPCISEITLAGFFSRYTTNSDRIELYADKDVSYEESVSVQYVLPREAEIRQATNVPSGAGLVLSPRVLRDFVYDAYFSKSYTQASLFFSSDSQAHSRADELKEAGYIAIPSDTVYEETGSDAIIQTVLLVIQVIGWVIEILFIALFLSLCSTKAMMATKGDIAILRSMGIPTGVIKISIYIQTLLALIPAYIVTAVAAVLVFTQPKTNAIFTYLHAGQYVLLAASMLAINLLLSRRYVKKIFHMSVKKNLRGGAEA